MKYLSLPLLACCLFALPLLAQPADLGQTRFPNSGQAEAQEPFLQGLLLLHSFEYEDARDAFQEARRIDPDFAMAYWGEAMTHNHPVWMRQDTDAARAVLNALAPTPEERLSKAPTDREKDYLRAAEILFFGEGAKEDRDDAYAEAMARLAEQYPDDLDATAFYALALLGTAHEGRDFRTYMRAAAEAETVFARNPQHPGAAHYLIHSYDDPIHAPLGLPAARVYAGIAPAASHALHMPSHIFVALGMWDDVVAMNEASWAAADARVERRGLDVDQRNFHALWWLTYGYLQQGRFGAARDLLDIVIQDVERSGGSRSTRFHQTVMRAAYLIETNEWNGEVARLVIDTQGLSPAARATNWFVDGLAALEHDDTAAATDALDQLRYVAEETDNEVAVILAMELDAHMHLAAGKADAALHLLAEAAAAEETLPYDFGPPSPVKPAHELYGEALLALDRPAEAQEQFKHALERSPGRTLSLLGLARAASQAGDDATARHAYATLGQIWHTADAEVQGLGEVREAAATGSN